MGFRQKQLLLPLPPLCAINYRDEKSYPQDVGWAIERVGLPSEVEGDDGQLGDFVTVNHVLQQKKGKKEKALRSV